MKNYPILTSIFITTGKLIFWVTGLLFWMMSLIILFVDIAKNGKIISRIFTHNNVPQWAIWVGMFVALVHTTYCFKKILDCGLNGESLKAPEIPLSKVEILKRKMKELLDKEQYEQAVEIRNELRKLGVIQSE